MSKPSSPTLFDHQTDWFQSLSSPEFPWVIRIASRTDCQPEQTGGCRHSTCTKLYWLVTEVHVC